VPVAATSVDTPLSALTMSDITLSRGPAAGCLGNGCALRRSVVQWFFTVLALARLDG